MAFRDNFSHTIVLPMVDTIHETIIAFLQSFFGSTRVPKNCDVDNHGEFIPRTKPMLLEIGIRPSPQDISISIQHSVFSKQEVRRRDYNDYRAYWLRMAREEVNSLRQYLKKCYSLEVLPRLETASVR